jgi:transposase
VREETDSVKPRKLLENAQTPTSRVHALLGCDGVDALKWTVVGLGKGARKMSKSHPAYPEEFRRQILELVRAGRTPDELAEEFEPTAQTIRNWIKQSELDHGQRRDGLTSDEKSELSRLRKENKQLRLEREILSKAAAWFARETDAVPAKSSNS